MIRVPVSVCVPAPPGVFLPYGVCPGSPRTCLFSFLARVVDGGVTATGVLSRQRGNLITIVSTR